MIGLDSLSLLTVVCGMATGGSARGVITAVGEVAARAVSSVVVVTLVASRVVLGGCESSSIKGNKTG